MGLSSGACGRQARFEADVEASMAASGHAGRSAPLRRYCAGPVPPGERKSVEPIAARIDPMQASAAHQSLHHLLAKAEWSDAAMLAAIRA